jgi:ABC-type transport system involved in multi-copper enzyme maturation permease subunit
MPNLRISLRSIYSVAKKEFADNLRNRWIVALTIIFVVLTIATSYLAGGKVGSSSGFGGMENTVVVLLSISSLLIPLISIMLGYATISGECESGSLGVLLAYPIKRIEIFLGKFLGLGSVLIVSIVIGFGAGGIIIAGVVGTASWTGYLVFIALTILLGLLYLSVSMFFSTLCKKRVTSLGAGVILFFWSMIIGMIVFGIYLGSGGSFEEWMAGGASFPDWVWWCMLLSPTDMSQMAIMQAFSVKQVFGIPVEMPSFMNLTLLILVQLIWIIEPLMLAIYFFGKRDI